MRRPTPERPLRLLCPVCSGRAGGCSACAATGTLSIDDCPARWAGAAMRVVELAQMAERGAWWRSGGLSAQPAKYVSMVRCAGDELAHCRSED